MGKKKDQDENVEQKKHDPLLAIMKKCGFAEHQVLEEEAAIQVKNEALRSLKERLLTRATIILAKTKDLETEMENRKSQSKPM